MVQKKVKLPIITGPTAVGKSALAVEVALKFGGEVVGADSIQVYKGLDIGTGKVTIGEMRGVPHHMIDVVSPDIDYSVGAYVVAAKNAIDDIVSRGQVPILTGGTGLYINSLLFNHSFAGAPKDDKIRDELKRFAAEEGNEKLYERLRSVDPESAAVINVNDTKRLIRALEIYEITGKPRSEFKDSPESAYDYQLIILTDDRETIYDKIERRVDKMVEMGLVDEVKSLYKYKNCNSMQGIGYKEIISYLDGECALDEAIALIKQSSRRYAKRQLTFMRGMKAEKIFVNVNEFSDKIIKEFLG